MITHFLELRRPLFELHRESFYSVLFLGDSCFQLSYGRLLHLYSFVFFEELVEQHRADLVVADAFGFPFRPCSWV